MYRREVVSSAVLLGTASGCLRFSNDASASTSTERPDGDTFELLVVGADDSLVSVVTTGALADVSRVQRSRQDSYYVTVTLTDAGRTRFRERLRAADAFDRPRQHPVFVRVEGEDVSRFVLSRNLIDSIRSGDWDGRFRLSSDDRERLSTLAETV